MVKQLGGSKIHQAEYSVIKTLKGKVSNKTISVGYYSYIGIDITSEIVLLTLIKYRETKGIKHYYHFPKYDAKKGIKKVKIDEISFDYWEGCETGKGECKPLTFYRNPKVEKWFLLMPCGGTQTSVTLSKEKGILKDKNSIYNLNISTSECPPIFDLTNLENGKYYAYMLSCGLGGQVEINLKQKKE